MKFGSLFSGIGGFDLGFQRAGLECAWQVEIDKDCQRVLKRHWPNVQRFDDVSTVREFSAVDVLCGGFPCQDLSVAGKRAGLAGERSGLWFEFLRIIKSNLPRWVVIENVPGLLSSESGADFRIIIDGLVSVGYCVGWRVFDAQYFGVAQRRRRVFIVGSLGNGSCAEILFESESVPWNPPTRGEARARTAEVSVRRAQTGSNGWGVRTDGSTGTLDGTGGDAVIAEAIDVRNLKMQPDGISGTMQHKKSGGYSLNYQNPILAAPITANYGKQLDNSDRNGGPPNLIAFSSKDHGADAGEISPTLRSMNFDQSRINGGGQVAIAFDTYNQRDCGDKAQALSSGLGTAQHNAVAIAFKTDQDPEAHGDICPTLQVPSRSGGGQQHAVAFAENQRGEVRTSEVAPQLSCSGGKPGSGYSADAFQEAQIGCREYESAGSLRANAPGTQPTGTLLRLPFGVRRLTPRECERLQGFPDDWTRYDSEGKEVSDSARYRMLGNAVEVDCAEWIGTRIAHNSMRSV